MMHSQGIYWEKGALQGCYVIFRDETCSFSVGTENVDSPQLLINSDAYVYLYVTSANNGCPNDYYVIEDFDGPFVLRHSGYVYTCGGQRIQLL